MELNLKRALKLRKELEATVARVDIPTSVSVSLFGEVDVQAVIDAARKEVGQRIATYGSLSAILASLRTQIARNNSVSGIEELLAEIAHTDRLIGMAKKLAGLALTPSDAELNAVVSLGKRALDTPATDAYAREPVKSVSFDLATQAQRDQAIDTVNELKRSRETLDDRRAGTNANTKITIADDDANLLRKLGLI